VMSRVAVAVEAKVNVARRGTNIAESCIVESLVTREVFSHVLYVLASMIYGDGGLLGFAKGRLIQIKS
jgi:hypothetical protein